MGALPKQRHTKGRRNRRRMHIYIDPKFLGDCPKCAKPVLGHTACKNCGFYKGKEVVNVLGKLTKKEKKVREKEIKEAGNVERKA